MGARETPRRVAAPQCAPSRGAWHGGWSWGVCAAQRKQCSVPRPGRAHERRRGAGVRVRPALGQGLTHIYGRTGNAAPRRRASMRPPRALLPTSAPLVHSDNRAARRWVSKRVRQEPQARTQLNSACLRRSAKAKGLDRSHRPEPN